MRCPRRVPEKKSAGDELPMSSSQHVYEIRARKDRRGIDLIGERLPLGVFWFEGPDAIDNAVNYARSVSYPHPAIIRVLNESGDALDDRLEQKTPFPKLASAVFVKNGEREHSRFCSVYVTVLQLHAPDSDPFRAQRQTEHPTFRA